MSITPSLGYATLVAFESTTGPGFVDGRTGDGTVGLAPHTEPPFTGARWELLPHGADAFTLRCLGAVDGPRYLAARADGSVRLVHGSTSPDGGTRWAIGEVPGGVTLRCRVAGADGYLAVAPDGHLTLAPGTPDGAAPPRSVWRAWRFGELVTLQCLGHQPGSRFLDGRTADGSVGLAPSTEPPFVGAVWLAVIDDAVLTLRSLGGAPDARRVLDGLTSETVHDHTVRLAPSTDPPLSGTRWLRVPSGSGVLTLRCQGTLPGPRRVLDGRTDDASVELVEAADEAHTGARWHVGVPNVGAADAVAPGASLALFHPPSEQLEVFAVDDDGALRVCWQQTRNRSWRTHALTPPRFGVPGAPLGGAWYPPHRALEVLTAVAGDGPGARHGPMTVTWKADDGVWRGPVPVTDPRRVAVPAGAAVAAAYYPPHETLEAFVVDAAGALWVVWKSGTTAWRSHPVTDDGFAPPGAHAAAAHFDEHGTLEVLVVDTDGAVRLLWKTPTEGWSAERRVALTAPGFAPPGAPLALVRHPGHRTLEAFVVDDRGTVWLLWKSDVQGWRRLPLTGRGFAPPGAPVTAVYHPDGGRLELFVVGNDRALWLLWKSLDEPWHAPVQLGEPGYAPLRAPLCAVHHPPVDELAVFLGDPAAIARVMSRHANRPWRPCAPAIATRAHAPARDPRAPQTARLMQVSGDPRFRALAIPGVDLGCNTEHDGTLVVTFGDVPRPPAEPGPEQDADAIAYARELAPGGIQLDVVARGGAFAPFTIRHADGRLRIPGNAQTPVGSFSHAGTLYVIALVHEGPSLEDPFPVVTYVVQSRDPASGAPFDEVFRWSDGKFWQAAPWVVRNGRGLPPGFGLAAGDAPTDAGVVLLGGGPTFDGRDGVHLAWLPLSPPGPGASGGPVARDRLRYHAGALWSADERAARPLWYLPAGYTSQSLCWVDGAERWIALYSRADIGQHRERSPVVARVAASPTGAWSDEIVVFDPCRDGAYGNFMHWPDLDRLHETAVPPTDERGWAYGAFIIAPLTQWHPADRTVTLHYLLSSHRPYEVHLMRSRFPID